MAHVALGIMNLQQQQRRQAISERRRRICNEEEEIVLKENDIAAKQMIDAEKNKGEVKKHILDYILLNICTMQMDIQESK